MRRLIVAAVFWAWMSLPAAAQAPAPQAADETAAESGSALPWAVAAVFTLAILCIVCLPSRKSQT